MAGTTNFISKWLFCVVFIATIFVSCKKTEDKNFDNNTAISPHRIPTIKIEGYVNRVFIDLIGRTPLEDEMAVETDILKADNLSKASREALVTKLQTDDTPVVGDSSYRIAYGERLYIIIKSRMIEGAEDSEFSRYIGGASVSLKVARINGDSIRVFRALEIIEKNQKAIDAKFEYRNEEISINEVFARMLNNGVYDNINMNTFNFVNASYDDLFYRFPTKTEFDIAFNIIEKNEIGPLFGGFAGTKGDYCQLLTQSDEFYEGLIRWTYLTLLNRDPTTAEVSTHFQNLQASQDFRALQKEILITDEYADF
ncbi:MAG: hypothetical protein ACI9JN_002376 [Bacteroidia bacterium]|jgi:hypothetical protein